MPDHILMIGVFFLGVAAGFFLAWVAGLFPPRRMSSRDRLEFNERMKS